MLNKTCYILCDSSHAIAADAIDLFVYRNCFIPMNFYQMSYFLRSTLDSTQLKETKEKLFSLSDEVWVFGVITDEILEEIIKAKQNNKEIKFFKIFDEDNVIKKIIFVNKENAEFNEKLCSRYSIEDLSRMI